KAALSGYGGTTDDAQLAVELGIAEAQVAAFCGWPVADDGTRSFLSGTYTVYPERSAARPRLLPLFYAPSAVTTVHATESDDYDSTTLVASTDYTVTRDGLWRVDGSTWARAYRGNKVVGTFGWASDSAPDTVEAAVIAQAVHRWRILRKGQGIAQATQQGSSLSRDALTALPDVVQQMAIHSPAYHWGDAIG
ncbi:MAG: hypothetical protein LPK38_00970, partial [Actinomycetes bacterium]|nr:hypothetical protein [Actinomycetes bacterium]MDX5449591.1 hypothetical protein [Actinomycetes bacterium]